MAVPSDLLKYGITDIGEIIYNPSYNTLFAEETRPDLGRFERGIITRSGAISVDTGSHTDCLTQDRYVVLDEKTRDTVWWKSGMVKISENKPVSHDIWHHCKNIAAKQLSGKRLFVTDCYCGAKENSRIAVRFVTEIAWQAHFIKNIFIRPEQVENENYEPDFTVLVASKSVNREWQEQGLSSGNFIIFNFSENMAVIGGTFHTCEIKRCLFSVMNYHLSFKGIASLHCAANVGHDGAVALFLGPSGTGKTTLATDPGRMLIGDDAHGWDDEGIFSFEGGCYPKCHKLSREDAPDIFDAIKRDALLENLVVMSDGRIDFNSDAKTENTRVSYPLYHISNIVKPVSVAGHPEKIIILTVDGFGVLPPASLLSEEQAKYYFMSGYTTRIARTERELVETVPSFSCCFVAPFLMVDPVKNANDFASKMKLHGSEAWLVNTGVIGSPMGTGNRIDLRTIRQIITSILDDSIKEHEFVTLPVFNLSIPSKIRGIDDNIIDPVKSWDSQIKWHIAATDLALKFINNFSKFITNPETAYLADFGPRIS